MFGFVTRRRHETELAAAGAEVERLREQRDQFAKDRDAYRAAAETAAGQFADADEQLTATRIVNACLTEDLAKAREQITDGSVAEWRAKAKAAERRADQWQKQYYDAVGLGPGRIEDSSRWQPGYKAPKPEGSAS
jgi:predicted  nucleic acid-binding Zn-ribbon protein